MSYLCTRYPNNKSFLPYKLIPNRILHGGVALRNEIPFIFFLDKPLESNALGMPKPMPS